MKCRKCGSEIADKALICYRCGTATTEARVAPAPMRRRRHPLIVAIAMVILIAVAVFALPLLEPGTERTAGWIALAVITFLTVLWLKPTASRRR